jgi:signal peptidase I
MSLLSTKNKPENTTPKAPAKPKSALREWLDAIVFAVIVATLFRWFFVEPFTIPTPSMEKSLLVGDYLFVSKLHYGARTPKTPLQIPLAANKIWGTEIPSFLRWIQLPQYRLPGFSEVTRNDAVVFNYPPEVDLPTDMKTYYIKRCIGLPGEEISMQNQQVYIDGKPIVAPIHSQTSYALETREILKERVFQGFGITDVDQTANGYQVHTDSVTAEELRKAEFTVKLTKQLYEKSDAYSGARFFSQVNGIGSTMLPKFDWTIDNFGPMRIPKKGAVLPVEPQNLFLYEHVIRHYEGNEDVKVEGGKLMIGGKEVTSYTFKQNYYFMMGDNRHNSADSRFWGFVPEDHILGKALFVWLSVNPNPSEEEGRVRWKRLFTGIE